MKTEKEIKEMLKNKRKWQKRAEELNNTMSGITITAQIEILKWVLEV